LTKAPSHAIIKIPKERGNQKMKKYNFVIGFINARTNQPMNDVVVEVRAFTYKGARTKALNLGQAIVRDYDKSGVCAYMRVCKM